MSNLQSFAKSGIYAAGFGRQYLNLWWSRRAGSVNPWTDWNRDTKTVFIHIPKNGGTSMYNTFGMDHPPETHCPVVGYRYSDPERWAETFSFAFVRNPWDRFVSAFHYLKRKPLTEDDRLWSQQNLSECEDFEGFVTKLQSSRSFLGTVMMWRHFAPQWWYVADESGKVIIDHLGRFEDFATEVGVIGDKLGISTNVVHENKVTRAHYSDYYSPETVDFVGRLYKGDIKRFSYQFQA